MGLHIALYQPEIPPNTGNVARTCVATETTLHLIKPLGFNLEDKHLRRAGLDYWEHLDLRVHDSGEAFMNWLSWRPFYLATRHGGQRYDLAPVEDETVFVFGRETKGLPQSWFERYPERMLNIPMWGKVRSLNMSNAAAIVIYDAYRRFNDFLPTNLDN